ncbi:MAG: hypothetical protein WD066_15065 [Planctomycetaceae bacterium]
MNDLRAAALIVPLPANSQAVVPDDPDDDPIIATAVVGKVDVLCTLDRHIRLPEVEAYCAARNTRVMTDVDFLELLRESDTEPE